MHFTNLIQYFLFVFLDTETLYTKMMKTLASRYNAQFSWDVKVKQMGKKQSEAGKVFIGLYFILSIP